MKTRSKLVVLQTMEGLFGWVSILGGFAALYFLVTAIGFGGAWTNVLVAVAVAMVARWLASGLLENKRRIAIEQSQMGADRGQSPPSAADMGIGEAEQIIRDYGGFLMQSAPAPGTVADVARLPHPKERIKKAILLALAVAGRGEATENLKTAYIMLADFQPNVGRENAGFDPNSVDMDQKTTEQLATAWLNQTTGTEELSTMVNAEMERLKTELAVAGHWSG